MDLLSAFINGRGSTASLNRVVSVYVSACDNTSYLGLMGRYCALDDEFCFLCSLKMRHSYCVCHNSQQLSFCSIFSAGYQEIDPAG